MQKSLEKRILNLFRKAKNDEFRPADISKLLGANVREVTKHLNELVLTGALVKHGKSYRLGGKSFLEGIVTINKKGEGFVSIEGYEDDFYISPTRLSTAMHKDLVRIVPFSKSSRSNRREAEVLEIVERSTRRIVGTFRRGREFAFVVPDDPRFRRDIYVAAEKELGALEGQKVVIALERWIDEYLNPEGAITEILGFPDEVGVDVLSVVKQHDLHFDFPKPVLLESEAIPEKISERTIVSRLDFRQAVCFTIDPVDAKDFDDAVSLEELPNGNQLLGVHIADVSHYVLENSPIDLEAYRRGTSTYLVDRVIPMLPEKLSNNVCSLKPEVDRLAYSVFIELDANGQIHDYDICETTIHSRRRFTYEEIQAIISGAVDTLRSTVMRMHTLSKVLLKNRRELGSIDFDSPEAKFKLDAKGKPIECLKKERLDSHRLVEEFMLLANQVVARHIGGNAKSVNPFLYRIHDRPPADKLENFARLLKVLGYSLGSREHITPQQIQRIIDKVKGKKEATLIEKVAIRTMAKAEYSRDNIGHFGLAFPHYSHFTSPIRRYPDLIVHRLLKEYAVGMTSKRLGMWNGSLQEIARHTSARERVATEAERESIKLKQVEFMQEHVGLEYDGLVSGVMAYGLYVEITRMLIEGLVHVREMEDDHYVFDEGNYRLLGQRTKRVFRLGDPVRIRVVGVSREKREIDFRLVDKL